VFVDPQHRRRGVGRAMVGFLLEHPDLVAVTSWFLATLDAHGVYSPLGFEPLRHADRFLQRTGRSDSAGPPQTER
jgi:GNAT superfamily N-acetyltransferase